MIIFTPKQSLEKDALSQNPIFYAKYFIIQKCRKMYSIRLFAFCSLLFYIEKRKKAVRNSSKLVTLSGRAVNTAWCPTFDDVQHDFAANENKIEQEKKERKNNKKKRRNQSDLKFEH